MANPNSPFGFKPIRRLDGAAWSGNLTSRKILGTNNNVICKGDVVITVSTGYIDVGAAGKTDHSNLGIFYGCHYFNATIGYNIWSNRWPGSNSGALNSSIDVDAFIIDDPLVVFEVMASAAAIPFGAIGENADYVVATGNVLSGISAWTLNSTTGSTATFPFRVVGLGNAGVNTSPGYDSASANNIVEVCWNDQFYKQTASI